MKPHRFDPLSFAFGVVYTLIGVIFLIPATPLDLVDTVTGSLRWVWPLAILVIGGAVLLPLARGRDTD